MILNPIDCDHFIALFYQAIDHCKISFGSCVEKRDVLVWERHSQWEIALRCNLWGGKKLTRSWTFEDHCYNWGLRDWETKKMKCESSNVDWVGFWHWVVYYSFLSMLEVIQFEYLSRLFIANQISIWFFRSGLSFEWVLSRFHHFILPRSRDESKIGSLVASITA